MEYTVEYFINKTFFSFVFCAFSVVTSNQLNLLQNKNRSIPRKILQVNDCSRHFVTSLYRKIAIRHESVKDTTQSQVDLRSVQM